MMNNTTEALQLIASYAASARTDADFFDTMADIEDLVIDLADDLTIEDATQIIAAARTADLDELADEIRDCIRDNTELTILD